MHTTITMHTTTIQKIEAAIGQRCKHPKRLRSWGDRMVAKDAAYRILAPMVPEGTLQWVVMPGVGESAVNYASRAYYAAAESAAWAGGLKDGTSVWPDAAIVASVSSLLQRT